MTDLTKQILDSVRRASALQLWQLGGVKVNLGEPFKLTSGNYSPIYLNCRKLISSAAFADLFAAAARMICEAGGVRFDIVAGGETAGIPFAAFLARTFGKPMIYVRKAAKEHGVLSLIEGVLAEKARVLLVEDLITDAGSKLHFISGITDTGGIVEDVLVFFDRQQGGREALKVRGIRLHSITDMSMVLEVAEAEQILSSDEFKTVREYLRSPADWHEQKGLAFKQ